MSQSNRKIAYLPLLVGVLGIILTGAVSVFLWLDTRAEFAILTYIEDRRAVFTLIFGLFLTAFIALLIHIVRKAQRHAIEMDKMNATLKQEMADRKTAEASQQKLEIALLQGQKLQAMGTLAGGIAHDFNNILYAIIGYTEMTREDVTKDSQTHKNLGKILDASKRGQELVSRILSFSRRQTHAHEALQIKSVIDAALSLLRPTVPASVTIDYSGEQDFTITGNQTQLHQVLVNLINNAVDAMDAEGEVSINIGDVQEEDSLLEQYPALPKAHYCKIEIADTGHGIDKHTIDRIFEPFYTTKEVGKGTGLGLSIVHNIVKDHHGEISVSSKLGQGTKFMILLPIQSEQGA